MSTLLLRLSAPLQAWGCECKFETRRTCREPTKSAVIGLLVAALGRSRDQCVADLNQLRFGVRVDREGSLLHDYHTVRPDEKNAYVTHRYYLSDAIFLAGLEHPDAVWLAQLKKALLAPAFPLYLGRRSCPPTLPLVLGIRPCALREALQKEPWLVPDFLQKKGTDSPPRLRIFVDADPKDSRAALQKDLPLSFHPERRQYTYRPVAESVLVMANPFPELLREKDTDHDAMSEL